MINPVHHREAWISKMDELRRIRESLREIIKQLRGYLASKCNKIIPNKNVIQKSRSMKKCLRNLKKKA